MAGYSCIFAVGSEGGFQGADGIIPDVLIMVGEGNRRWLEPVYLKVGSRKKKDMLFDERVTVHIPDGPDDKNMLIDAMMLFCADYFKDCPTFNTVKRLWFEGKIRIFKSAKWAKLREEALQAIRDQEIMICIAPFHDLYDVTNPF